jgi:glycoprotein-N-acetylgalactosamine 3-beta-galactosyltransferase
MVSSLERSSPRATGTTAKQKCSFLCIVFAAAVIIGGPTTLLSSIVLLSHTVAALPAGVAARADLDAALQAARPSATWLEAATAAAAAATSSGAAAIAAPPTVRVVPLQVAPKPDPKPAVVATVDVAGAQCPLPGGLPVPVAGRGLEEVGQPTVHRKVFPLGGGGGKKRYNATIDVWRGASSYAAAGGTLPRILCWVLAHGPKHPDAKRVMRTWGKRCDCLLFISDKADALLKTVVWALPHEGSIEVMITKTLRAWRYVYENFADDYDYFIKADTDTYVVVDNLRHFVLQPRFTTRPAEPHFLGRRFNFTRYGVELFHAGGPGYAMNRAALNLLMCSYLWERKPYGGDGGDATGAQKASLDPRLTALCDAYPDALLTTEEKGLFKKRRALCVEKAGNHEDVMTARCLRPYGVYAEDTRDEWGGERFLPLGMSYHFNPEQALSGWYKKYSPKETTNGHTCCAKMLVSFHGVAGSAFDVLEQGLRHSSEALT